MKKCPRKWEKGLGKKSGFDILKIPTDIFDKLGAREKIMIDLKKEPALIKKGEVAIFRKLIEKSKKRRW